VVLPNEESGQGTGAGERWLQHVEATPGGVVKRHQWYGSTECTGIRPPKVMLTSWSSGLGKGLKSFRSWSGGGRMPGTGYQECMVCETSSGIRSKPR
jgi:hypothetical protein